MGDNNFQDEITEQGKIDFLDQEYEKERQENNRTMLLAEKEERGFKLEYRGLKE